MPSNIAQQRLALQGVEKVAPVVGTVTGVVLAVCVQAYENGLMNFGKVATETQLAAPSTALSSLVGQSSGVSAAQCLYIFRLFAALTIWGSLVKLVGFAEPTVFKLRGADGITIEVVMQGARRFCTFTVWHWTLMGVYFLLTSIASSDTFSFMSLPLPQSWSVRLPVVCWILYETLFALALLVTIVVSFVLIPAGRMAGIDMSALFGWIPLLMHNANSVFMFVEVTSNNLTIEPYHFCFPLLFGLCYTLFAWWYFTKVGFYFYFFLDHRRKRAWVAYVLLFGALGAFFGLGSWLSRVLTA